MAVSLAACGGIPVTIHDHELCGDKEAIPGMGAHCAHTLVHQTRDLSKADWDTLRSSHGLICAESEMFADWKAALETLCNNCDTTGDCKCNYATMKPEAKSALFHACRGDFHCANELGEVLVEAMETLSTASDISHAPY